MKNSKKFEYMGIIMLLCLCANVMLLLFFPGELLSHVSLICLPFFGLFAVINFYSCSVSYAFEKHDDMIAENREHMKLMENLSKR